MKRLRVARSFRTRKYGEVLLYINFESETEFSLRIQFIDDDKLRVIFLKSLDSIESGLSLINSMKKTFLERFLDEYA